MHLAPSYAAARASVPTVKGFIAWAGSGAIGGAISAGPGGGLAGALLFGALGGLGDLGGECPQCSPR